MLYAGCQWGMLSVLAKFGSPSIVGQFTLGLAVSAPVFMFTNLQLRAVQATDVSAECSFADYFTLRLVATLLGLMVILALLPLTGASFAIRIVVLLVSVSKCFECMSDVTAGLLQREEQLKRVAISLMIRGSSSVLIFSLTFVFFRNLALSVAAMSGVWLAVFLLYDVPNARKLIGLQRTLFRFDPRTLWRLTILSLPLGWIGTIGSLNVNIPRYFLQHYLGVADQGIYASLAYLIVAINLVVAALSQSVTTRLARLYADGEIKRFVHLLIKLSQVGLLILAVGVPTALFVGRPLLTLLYRREYGDHAGLLALLVGTAGLNTIGTFLFCGVTAARSFRAQVPVYFAATLMAGIASALLVPRYGINGAGVGLLLSAITFVLGSMWVIKQVVRSDLHLRG
jgi:O-antigen/teichoic acid export membrane protein